MFRRIRYYRGADGPVRLAAMVPRAGAHTADWTFWQQEVDFADLEWLAALATVVSLSTRW